MDFIEKILEDINVIGAIKNGDDSEYERILSNINFIPKKSFSEKLERFGDFLKKKNKMENIIIKETQHAN